MESLADSTPDSRVSASLAARSAAFRPLVCFSTF